MANDMLEISRNLIDLWRVGFPNRGRRQLARVLATHLWYAVKGVGRAAKAAPSEEAVLPSPVWQAFNRHLRFQLQYYAPRDQIMGPVIRHTAGGFLASQLPYYEGDLPEEVDVLATDLAGLFPVDAARWKKWLSIYAGALATFNLNLRGSDTLEIGPGIGAGMVLAARLSGCRSYSYDMPEMRTVQRVVHDFYCSAHDLPRDRLEYLVSVEEVVKRIETPYSVLSFWAFSEMPVELRDQFGGVIEKSRFALFAANAVFEGVDNEAYFAGLAQKIGRRHEVATLPLAQLPAYMQKHRLHLIF